ncbi:pyruvate, phosphate dikinase [Acidimicrobiia bacterium EGI L10123]|uniref:pyruvate, phosphate dikinase n=1 Tax=Salinilacustrithrix flava TaxID=2957203 RepID=UPI003D7C2A77|nr:pyruvate, phosphate dikinase [Acidimicrobiia bacterium EGI L10123]
MDRRPAFDAGVVPVADACDVDPSVIGAKAASLARMVDLGLRVPPAFVVTTDVCRLVRQQGRLPVPTVDAIRSAVTDLELATGRGFGGDDPLLVSVRSGAETSMPGMMDTVLDVGFAPGTRAGLAARAGETFARGCHARFLAGWASIVLGVDPPRSDDPDELARALGGSVPDDPHRQLVEAVEAVFRSWDNERARAYRERHGIDDGLGTAVVVQAMVFGNQGAGSGAGVVSSRDPSTGAPGLRGDLLVDAQGEDVVAGSHRPRPIDELGVRWPEVDRELRAAVGAIESATRDMVDVEFTIEDGTLHLLQSRVGARAAAAAVRIAVDLVDEGAITVAEALARVDEAQLDHASRPTVDPEGPDLLAAGLGACPGVTTGEVCLSSDHVASHDGPVVLVRRETSPDDIRGMVASAGVLTARGGLVSHAALVARELDLPAVVGVEELEVDEATETARVGQRILRDGDVVTIDGTTGRVHLGAVPVVPAAPSGHLARMRAWQAELDPG